MLPKRRFAERLNRFLLEGICQVLQTAETVTVIGNNLKSRDFFLRAHIWVLATLIPLLVRMIPLRRLVSLLTPPDRMRLYQWIGEDRITDLVQQRLVAPRNMRRRFCLREGLLVFHFLRLSGRSAVLHFSVFPPETDPIRLHAHCWVTLNGQEVSKGPEGPHSIMFTHGQTSETHR